MKASNKKKIELMKECLKAIKSGNCFTFMENNRIKSTSCNFYISIGLIAGTLKLIKKLDEDKTKSSDPTLVGYF